MTATLVHECIPLRREVVDVGVLIELTTEVMHRQAVAHGVTLRVHVDDAVPQALPLDRDKFAWVVTSLVGSALRHVRPRDGVISVDVHWDGARSELSMAVCDNGPGIPREHLGRLLNRGPWRPGAALALTLIAEIAAAHGGSMAIESQTDPRDHFTRVSLTIPIEDDPLRSTTLR
ncbi:MAG TPA: HAMP domain-containing sensor histidine kinase [Vicinamibacterales bacterium]|nr:HAMP domain-containing sensor histidine kinase [Vicinamibacterales bacterium]